VEELILDRAFWITWYDLRVEGRDAYLSWLHGSYTPKVQAVIRKKGMELA